MAKTRFPYLPAAAIRLATLNRTASRLNLIASGLNILGLRL